MLNSLQTHPLTVLAVVAPLALLACDSDVDPARPDAGERTADASAHAVDAGGGGEVPGRDIGDGGASEVSPGDDGAATDAETAPAEPQGRDAGADAGGSAADLDARDAALGADPDADAPVEGGEGCGSDAACTESAPLCVEGLCMTCEDGCAARDLVCDAPTQTCVAEPEIWQLDCDDLPTNTPCAGGPREVLLAVHGSGRTAMLDPEDGHFLGYLRPPVQDPSELNRTYMLATQGPDLCLWATHREKGVERWNTDGTFRDAIIAPGHHYDDGKDMIDDVWAVAFRDDEAYVGSFAGSPVPRIIRFTLEGTQPEVVWDDGVKPSSLQVRTDGTLVIADRGSLVLLGDPETGKRTSLWSVPYPEQVAPAGPRSVLVTGRNGGVARIDVGTGELEVTELQGVSRLDGVAQLDNGQYLVTGGDDVRIASVDPTSVPRGRLSPVLDDPALYDQEHGKKIGRACLPQEVVDAAAPDWALGQDCPSAPSGTPLFAADFEGADVLASYTDPGVHATVVTDCVGGTGGCLQVDGGGDTDSDWVRVDVGGVQPAYVGFRLRAAHPEGLPFFGGYLVLEDEVPAAITGFYIDGGMSGASLLAYDLRVSHAAPSGSWLHVELHDIDWTARTYDLCVDGKLVAANALFRWGSGSAIRTLLFRNLSAEARMWVDDLVLR